MSFDLTKNMPQGIKSNIQEAKSRIEAIEDSVGSNDGICPLDSAGKVSTSFLPSYVDDITESDDFESLPTEGETGKIYITVDDNLSYRWSGTQYVEVSKSLALGETSSTAYRGDNGKTAYNHSQITDGNPHGTDKTDVGLGNVPNVDCTNPNNIVQNSLNRFVSDAEKNKLAGIEEGAKVNVNANWDASSGDAEILNKPDLSVYNKTKWVKKNGNGVIANGDTKVYSNITTANIALSMPVVTEASDGNEHILMNKSSSTKNVVISPTGDGVTIDGGSNLTLEPGEYLTLIYDHGATDWFVKQ